MPDDDAVTWFVVLFMFSGFGFAVGLAGQLIRGW